MHNGRRRYKIVCTFTYKKHIGRVGNLCGVYRGRRDSRTHARARCAHSARRRALCGRRIIALVTGCSFVDGVFIPAGYGPITNGENCLSVYAHKRPYISARARVCVCVYNYTHIYIYTYTHVRLQSIEPIRRGGRAGGKGRSRRENRNIRARACVRTYVRTGTRQKEREETRETHTQRIV